MYCMYRVLCTRSTHRLSTTFLGLRLRAESTQTPRINERKQAHEHQHVNTDGAMPQHRGKRKRGGDPPNNRQKRSREKGKREGKPYACSMCSYRTGDKSSLTKHMRTHTGEKPYACSMCSYRSAVKSSLTTHMRTHTQVKDSKMMRRRPGVVTYL